MAELAGTASVVETALSVQAPTTSSGTTSSGNGSQLYSSFEHLHGAIEDFDTVISATTTTPSTTSKPTTNEPTTLANSRAPCTSPMRGHAGAVNTRNAVLSTQIPTMAILGGGHGSIRGPQCAVM